MAHAITGYTIQNGSRNLIVQFIIKSDGASGQYSDFTLLDLNDYTGNDGRNKANDFSVKKITVNGSVGAAAELKFGDIGEDHRTFFLGSIDTADGTNRERTYDGNLPQLLANPDLTVRLTSLGLDASGDWLDITLWIKKKYKIAGS